MTARNSQNEPGDDGEERRKCEVVAADVPGNLTGEDAQWTAPHGGHLAMPALPLHSTGGVNNSVQSEPV